MIGDDEISDERVAESSDPVADDVAADTDGDGWRGDGWRGDGVLEGFDFPSVAQARTRNCPHDLDPRICDICSAGATG